MSRTYAKAQIVVDVVCCAAVHFKVRGAIDVKQIDRQGLCLNVAVTMVRIEIFMATIGL
jgi:uncharacterized membrane protein YwzB